MRTLVITVIVFFTLCAAMAFNYSYINNVANELTEATRSLDLSEPEDCAKRIDEIKKRWEQSSPLFSLTVSFREIDYLGETLLALSAACENGDEAEFERYRALLIDAIDGVSRLERFSIVNIL